jgi:hypothetical protein
VEHL